ncbi:acyltransferase family protein [Sphingobacterium wenxiniae]|uniref:Predicted acyltransferase n=1 Tax=Sphingobacterium wenxiniae TaxID=683125 RepID=A0A1I6V4S7_9SPHI|nr:DUF5009 domain-containing protein [Sphingobacterium wenxiniae]SFT08671.1 Predicted acyltransferase [Sphingobacterium wenxiniae]
MKQRYYSLDVFRGATVAFMILVNNPGTWDHVFSPLLHAGWHGCTPTDLVFPFFLFAVGNAMAFVVPRLKEAGAGIFWKKVIKRTVLIFGIGLFLNWWPFLYWDTGELHFRSWGGNGDTVLGVRILGVLQRIALAYFFASIITYFFKPRGIIYLSAILLFAYWGICLAFGNADPYGLDGWFGTDVDKFILGTAHMYHGEGVAFDPEGIMSTIPSVVQVLFGYLVGLSILAKGQINWLWQKVPFGTDPNFRLVSGLMVTGFILLVLGWAWSLGFPINKKIWTSSYVLYTTGLAILTLGTALWYIEIQGVRNVITRFFETFGKNPLFIYIMSSMIPGLLELVRIPQQSSLEQPLGESNVLEYFYNTVCAKIPGPPEIGSLFYALCFLALMWAIGYFLEKRKIYIKV